jgi:hypothetical protein
VINNYYTLQIPIIASILKAFAVNDGRAGLVVFSFGDPHLLEGRQGREDGPSDPHGVLSLRGGDYLDFHGRGG